MGWGLYLHAFILDFLLSLTSSAGVWVHSKLTCGPSALAMVHRETTEVLSDMDT